MADRRDPARQRPPRPPGAAPFRITGTVQHAAWQERVQPPVEKVRPGLWSIPVPMPNSPLRYTSIYVIEYGDGVAIVDTGWPDDVAWNSLMDGLNATGHAIADVRAVLISHAHYDHHGLSERVREASGAWVGMHPAEALTVERFEEVHADSAQRMRQWAVQSGADSAAADLVYEHYSSRPLATVMAAPDVLIEDGDLPLGTAAAVRAIWTPGHTPGHLCYAKEDYDLLVTGDHILPRISPNISMYSRNGTDPLHDYLASLALIATREPAEVLPAHEYRFSGLATRAHDLLQHHYNRLTEITRVITDQPGITTWAIAEQLKWSRSWAETTGQHRTNAVSETLAHLVYLENNHQVRNESDVIDAWVMATGRPRVD